MIFYKIVSSQIVNRSKIKRYSVFWAVNSSKRSVDGGWKGDYGGRKEVAGSSTSINNSIDLNTACPEV